MFDFLKQTTAAHVAKTQLQDARSTPSDEEAHGVARWQQQQSNSNHKPASNEQAPGTQSTGPVSGHWANADWLLCRDGRWHREGEPASQADYAEAIAKTAGMIARREHPLSTDPRVDRIAARENYLADLARNDPEKTRDVAEAFRASPERYAEIAGVSPEKLGSYASIIEKRLALIDRYQSVGVGAKDVAAPAPAETDLAEDRPCFSF